MANRVILILIRANKDRGSLANCYGGPICEKYVGGVCVSYSVNGLNFSSKQFI